MDISPFNAQSEHLMHERELAKAGLGAQVQEIRRQRRRRRLANLRQRAIVRLSVTRKVVGGPAPRPSTPSAGSGPPPS